MPSCRRPGGHIRRGVTSSPGRSSRAWASAVPAGETSAAHGRPVQLSHRPQGAAASDLPLPVLGDRIAAQVERLHQRTGRPVHLVAESGTTPKITT